MLLKIKHISKLVFRVMELPAIHKVSFLSVILLFVVSGCSLLPEPNYYQVNYYDLGEPSEMRVPGVDISVEPFMNTSAAGMEMLYRENKYKMFRDEFNKWVQTPGLLLTSYFQAAFSSNLNDKLPDKRYDLTIFGTIISFEFDKSSKSARLAVEYVVKESSSLENVLSGSEVFTVKSESSSPEHFAVAMSKAAGKFALRVKEQIVLSRKRDKK